MIVLETLIVAFSMFSALPMPRIAWREENMRFSLCAFPLVGVLIGLCCWGWGRLCVGLSLPAVLRGAGLCLLPVMLTGGIHLDGYCDTCDALASHSDVETKQKILKDPHVGAFAAIRLCCWFVADFALWTALPAPQPAAMIGLFGLSRTLSALALCSFPLREGSGLARLFVEAADQKHVRACLVPLALLFAGLLCASGGLLAALLCLPLLLRFRRMSEREFGGLSGDLAGWFLQRAELWMLAALLVQSFGGWGL